MPIPVTCPTCNSRIRLPDDAAGKRFRCPKCQGVIPGPALTPPVEQTDTGHLDASADRAENQVFEAPTPISPAARKAVQPDFNPFDDGTADEEETPRSKRYYKPKDDYNPFAEPQASAPEAGTPDPGELFDFGAVDPTQPAGSGDFDFPGDEESQTGRPRRRR